MNINYTQGIIIILTILACVLHTDCDKNEKLSSKSDKHLNKASSKSNHKDDENSSGGKKNNDSVEEMLLNIAKIIQGCIDDRTMNNKKFKTKLDDIYTDLVNPTINNLIKKQMKKVDEIKKKYEEDVKVLNIMNGSSSKNIENPSKKSNKKK